jgi:RNA polymerase sigma-70 factor, ECF subfamily
MDRGPGRSLTGESREPAAGRGDPPPDPDLAALRSGDEDAFRRLVDAESARLLRLAMIYLPTREAAEDAVQETWLAVCRNLDGFAGRSSMRTWICQILINTARRNAGREARSIPFSAVIGDVAEAAVAPDRFLRSGPWIGHWSSPPDDWSRLPEDRLLSNEVRDVVDAAIGRLPPAQQCVITLRDVYGWSSAEVAGATGLEPGHLRVLLHRARSRVRGALERYLAVPGAVA